MLSSIPVAIFRQLLVIFGSSLSNPIVSGPTWVSIRVGVTGTFDGGGGTVGGLDMQ